MSKAAADGIYFGWESNLGNHEIHVEGKIDFPDEEEDSLDASPFTEYHTYTFGVK
jgi:tRNA U34 5-carboxymethylaminomethyl modifying GTPase MnmE/TrmE